MASPAACIDAVAFTDALRAPAGLIETAVAARLGRLVDAVPAGFTTFGFECRLVAGAPRVDAGFAFERPWNGPRSLASGRTLSGLRLARPPAPVRRLARAWGDPTTLLHTWVPFVFLEYDARSETPAGQPQPSLFLGLDWPLSAAATGSPDETHPVLQTVLEAVPLLLGSEHNDAWAAALTTCFTALPDGGRLAHIGVMLGRCGEVRLSVSLARTAVRNYLAAIGWTGRAEILDHMLHLQTECLADDDAQQRVQIDFDLDETIGPALNLLLRPVSGRWAELLDVLVRRGYSDPDKCAALLQWPIDADPPLTTAGRYRLPRYLSHVKLQSDAGGMLVAKAYLGVVGRGAGI